MGDRAGAERSTSDLLLPGPQPPLTHFGVTLLRHVVVTGLRYSFYHLGLPLPDKAPIRIHQLRLYLDGEALEGLLGGQPEGEAVAGALVDPGGVAGADERVPTGAAFFHRQRLRWARRRDLPLFEPPPPDSAATLEYHFRDQLSRCSPKLNDALLDEVLTVLERRRRRRRGVRLDDCLGPAAGDWVARRHPRLDRLGSPDPFTPSWAVEQPSIDEALVPRGVARDGGRGRFRELYRQTLDGLRPTLAAIADAARDNGISDHLDDLYFLPFELLGDMTRDDRPPWLAASLLRNRAEYFGLAQGADPATVAAWTAAPLHPLP
jgi:hypothetical protein